VRRRLGRDAGRSQPWDRHKNTDGRSAARDHRRQGRGETSVAHLSQDGFRFGASARARGVHRGDTLQIRYLAAGKRFGVIASIDARGQITFHLPEAPGLAVALDRDGERALPHAYELDDSPGFERFLFVTSDAAFATAEVVQALKSGAALPASLTSFELPLKKETP